MMLDALLPLQPRQPGPVHHLHHAGKIALEKP